MLRNNRTAIVFSKIGVSHFRFGEVSQVYGVPDGMGIQFDENSYLEDAANPVYARYVFTSAGSNTAARLTADGWSVLYESEKCMLYERTR